MKQLITLFALALCLSISSCGNKKASQNDTQVESSFTADANLPVYQLDNLLPVVKEHVDETLVVTGYVTHTCVHAGKRCFIVGENENVTMRIEAGGEIGGFNRELVGSELAIKGIIKESRLTNEYLNQYEKELKEGAIEEDGSIESCQAELSSLDEMREWMKANNKDYYSIYYMDGLDYEVLKK